MKANSKLNSFSVLSSLSNTAWRIRSRIPPSWSYEIEVLPCCNPTSQEVDILDIDKDESEDEVDSALSNPAKPIEAAIARPRSLQRTS